MRILFLILVIYFNISCSNEKDLVKIERQDTKKQNPNSDSNTGDSLVTNSNDLTSSNSKVAEDQVNKYADATEKDSDVSTDTATKTETTNTTSDITTTTQNREVLLPVYETMQENVNFYNANRNLYSYSTEKTGNAKLAFVVFPENSQAGLQAIYLCKNNLYTWIHPNINCAIANETFNGSLLGYVFVDHKGENRDFLIFCKTDGPAAVSVILAKNIVTGGECQSSNYHTFAPVGGTPYYDVETDQNGLESYYLKQ